ncbi:hypothetical protein BJY16_006200 [Actinoplanes octamycinicus]|uniref:SnoaL-like domain-containing protein n=1 Tax=Actinoplanes octamycinicus TaxID=135948 RepID=A0A7W7MAB2_9ACTN|nr:nuclear transport factor 2 family protein [Actinoplanes octamycinicus]MBB4742741.1 hypothetical protein [Actinoplanes octamycinicus]GIE63041.1 hypothetical protein Aoc01nite_84430 [Actinoplanes octamycinicus]
MTENLARAHVERFNAAVTSGDWGPFVAGLHPDAVMSFVGPPVGPWQGREAIAAAYAADPPDDTIQITGIRSGSDRDLVDFTWSRGGGGTLTLSYRDGQVAELIVRFG